MLEIVTGQEAVELGEDRLYVGAALLTDAVQGAVDLPFPVLEGQLVGQPRAGDRLRGHEIAVLQHGFQAKHVIRGLAVDEGALPRGIGVDHAP
ncbi:hypothetical protein D3C84_335780 [compost metagenome]